MQLARGNPPCPSKRHAGTRTGGHRSLAQIAGGRGKRRPGRADLGAQQLEVLAEQVGVARRDAGPPIARRRERDGAQEGE